MNRQVTIVGTGVTGLVAALECVRAGFDVAVWDRREVYSRETCSWVSAGMLAPDCEVVRAPQAVRTMGEYALRWWSKVAASFVQNGTLVVAPRVQRAELCQFARRSQHFEHCDQRRLTELEPSLAEHFAEALWFFREAHLDPRRTLPELVQQLESHGVHFHWGQCYDGDNEFVIEAHGSDVIGEHDELRGVKGEMLLVRAPDVQLQRPVRLLHARYPAYIVPRADGQFYVGASMIESHQGERVSVRSVAELLHALCVVHPAFAEAEIIEIGSGVRAAFPEHVPRVLWHNGRVVVNGMYRHGFLCAPSCAQQVVKLISTRELMEYDDGDLPQRQCL